MKLRTAILSAWLVASCSSGTPTSGVSTLGTELRAGIVNLNSGCEFESDIADTKEDELVCLDSAATRIDTAPVAGISSGAGGGFSSQMFVARTTDIAVEGDGVAEVMIDGNVILLLLPFPEVTNGIPVDFVVDGVRFRCELSNQFRSRMADICDVA